MAENLITVSAAFIALGNMANPMVLNVLKTGFL